MHVFCTSFIALFLVLPTVFAQETQEETIFQSIWTKNQEFTDTWSGSFGTEGIFSGTLMCRQSSSDRERLFDCDIQSNAIPISLAHPTLLLSHDWLGSSSAFVFSAVIDGRPFFSEGRLTQGSLSTTSWWDGIEKEENFLFAGDQEKFTVTVPFRGTEVIFEGSVTDEALSFFGEIDFGFLSFPVNISLEKNASEPEPMEITIEEEQSFPPQLLQLLEQDLQNLSPEDLAVLQSYGIDVGSGSTAFTSSSLSSVSSISSFLRIDVSSNFSQYSTLSDTSDDYLMRGVPQGSGSVTTSMKEISTDVHNFLQIVLYILIICIFIAFGSIFYLSKFTNHFQKRTSSHPPSSEEDEEAPL
ncbi:hypothetical protein COU77_01680 [Candidatus Peregrinibacteria bacterium CG10_big_fil_rev_8_21_14_0_10_49_16]|nr:MAG: hypothetical protein COU77_01680 [Candidatus Peregrinibacteria bacterium CG10_big_fil_rev_8_21_14_0_10_49_16]